ncbi:Heterokaryon incompatibility protein 6,OR allele [Lachnellula willkommii]|uniref:Heterokaryon incompatibility protein 6,OR allele n=1 Tax=Lachnellula willkommii TaxID=215461 RepID=A0A559MJ81_9HELO|nr:Heterokaryon incompatibility protein 6,OR allele [Lachnellula willkommii]
MSMIPLYEDAVFYELAAEITRVYEAFSRTLSPATADALLRHIMDAPDQQKLRIEDTVSDPILLELENLLIQEFFSSPFVYRPLDGQGAIRLLTLFPGSPCEPLRGTLQHINIPEKGFEAISYTWGGDSKPCFILLDGCQMSITQSLYNALVRLRYSDRSRKLWADGLCINQADNMEKGMQVALMPMIYTYARKVLVDLGVEADGSEMLPKLLESLGKLDFACVREMEVSPENFLSNGLPAPDAAEWSALVGFLCRPWFLRIWVIQEVVYARDIRFFCGNWESRWGLLAHMAEIFDSLLSINRYQIWNFDLSKARHAAASLALMLGMRLTRSVVAERLELLRRDIESIPPATPKGSHIECLAIDLVAKRELIVKSCREHRDLYPALERMIFALDGVKPSTTPIIKLLGMFPRNEATKPQDRIYALVGLAADINLEEFPPDYEETPYQTDLRFGRKLVEKGQGMDLIFHATKLPSEVRNLALPSWVPDWTQQRSLEKHWLKLGWAYNQYSDGFEGRVNSKAYISLVDGADKVLKVTGFRVDKLESVVKLYDDISEFSFPISSVTAASRKYFQQIEAVTDGDLYFTGQSWLEVHCRTLIADHLNPTETSIPDAIQQYKETKSIFTNDSIDLKLPNLNSWGRAWIGLMPEYVFCKTTRGFVGLVPHACSDIDEVFMFQGSDLPFMLRPVHTVPGLYRFIGGCYLHGLMKGEAWKSEQTLSEIFLF